MIKKIVSGVILLAVFHAESASAADMALKDPPQPVTSSFNWTGCYIGGHFGGTWGSKELSDPSGAATGGVTSLSANTGGFLPGGQIGCNYQAVGNWVLGTEGSFSASTLHGETQFPNVNPTSDFTVRGDWLASANGRIGYAWNPWLVYVEGGAAWVHERYEVSGTAFDFTASDTRTGWTVGGGLEYVFWGNWSADLKYAHYDFGTKNLRFVDLANPSTIAGTKQWMDAVTLGLNYHFLGGSWQPATPTVDEDSQKETVALNGGITVTKPNSLYGDFAALWGPGGLDNSGFRVRLSTVDGAYTFLQNGNTGPSLNGSSEEGTGMIGYEFVQGGTSILAASGVDYVTGRSSIPPASAGGNTGSRFPGTAIGSKSLLELYSNPTEQTMVYAEGSYSTAFREYYTQFEAGYAALGPGIYVGPKAVLLGDQNFDQYRLGGFVSGFKLGKVELGFSGGYLKDRSQGSGYFFGSDFYVRL